MRSMGLTMCLALLAFQRSLVEGASSMGCQEVRYAYSARGINVYDVPLTPQSGKGHLKHFDKKRQANLSKHIHKGLIV